MNELGLLFSNLNLDLVDDITDSKKILVAQRILGSLGYML